MKSKGFVLSVRAISFQDCQPMWSWSTNATDRQTDRRTTCSLNTALCTSASRGNHVTIVSVTCVLSCDLLTLVIWILLAIWKCTNRVQTFFNRQVRKPEFLWPPSVELQWKLDGGQCYYILARVIRLMVPVWFRKLASYTSSCIACKVVEPCTCHRCVQYLHF